MTKASVWSPTFISRPLSNNSLYLVATNCWNFSFSSSDKINSRFRFPEATSHFFRIATIISCTNASSLKPALAIFPATSPDIREVIDCFKAVIAWRALKVISDSAFFFIFSTSVAAPAFIPFACSSASAINFAAFSFAWAIIFSASWFALSTPSSYSFLVKTSNLFSIYLIFSFGHSF